MPEALSGQGSPARAKGGLSTTSRGLIYGSVRGDLLQHVDVECLAGDDLFQALVLGLELLQSLGIGRVDPAVGILPSIPGGLGDREERATSATVATLLSISSPTVELSDHLLGDVVKRTSSSETSISILEAWTYISAGRVLEGHVIPTPCRGPNQYVCHTRYISLARHIGSELGKQITPLCFPAPRDQEESGLNETKADEQPQCTALPGSKKSATRPALLSRIACAKPLEQYQLHPRCAPQGPAPVQDEPGIVRIEPPLNPERARNLEEWMEATAEMVQPGGESSSPSLPPRGELLTLTFTLDALEAELESFLYRLAFDSGSWIMEIAQLGASNACHLRLLVYEDAAVIAEILADDDRPSALPSRATRSMRSLGWEPPSQPEHPLWTAGSPATHSDISALSNMIVATLRHVLGLVSADHVALTLYGA